MVEVEWLSLGFSLFALIFSFVFSLVTTILAWRTIQYQFGAIMNLFEAKKGFLKIKNIGRGCAYLVSVNLIDLAGNTFSSYIIEVMLQDQEGGFHIKDFKRKELYSMFSKKHDGLKKEKCKEIALAYVSYQNEYRSIKFDPFLVQGNVGSYFFLPIQKRIFKIIKKIYNNVPRTQLGERLAERRIRRLIQRIRKKI